MGTDFETLVEQVARICHEANRAYCVTIGDRSQPAWDDAPDWQKESARAGVRGILDGSITTPEQSHESWMAQKVADGWVYGDMKNPDAKTHPCMVEYRHLPIEQQQKDAVFHAIVRAFSPVLSTTAS